MRQLLLEQIENLDSGEIVPAFSARIKKVFPQKRGTNSNGDWFLQNMIVTDGAKELTVTWCEQDTFDKWEGREMIFESTDTNHGKQGLKWEVRKVGEKTYSGIKVTGAAKIREVGDNQDAPRPPQQADPQPIRMESDPIAEARAKIARAVNGFALALDGVRLIADQYERQHLGKQLSQDQERAITSTLFILLSDNGLIAKLPTELMAMRGPIGVSALREGAGKLADRMSDEGVHGYA